MWNWKFKFCNYIGNIDVDNKFNIAFKINVLFGNVVLIEAEYIAGKQRRVYISTSIFLEFVKITELWLIALL